MNLLCKIGLHDWRDQATVEVTDNMVFKTHTTTHVLKKCSRCGIWNIDPRGFGFDLDEDGMLVPNANCTPDGA
jgi:hypothetical protein